MDRRADDRRTKRPMFTWPERRTGFDRRQRVAVAVLRDSSALLIMMLGVLNILNVLDFRFTLLALEHGATEANPIMTAMLNLDSLSAGAFKVALMVAISVAVWSGRKYRRILEFAVLATGFYAAIILYHVIGLTLLMPGV